MGDENFAICEYELKKGVDTEEFEDLLKEEPQNFVSFESNELARYLHDPRICPVYRLLGAGKPLMQMIVSL